MSYGTVNRWSTKADILEDLAEVTGRYTDVDEEFIVVGEEPPPVRRLDDDDEEFNLRFSGATEPYEMQRGNISPDLKGITQMLRMVEDYDEITENVSATPENLNDSIVTISKLNPNVPEFVPKGAIETSPRIKKSIIVNGNNTKNDDEKRNKNKANNEDSEKDSGIRIDKKLDISKLNAEEIKDISIKLRNKISDVSKKNDLHTKKDKNVAIAALLKLYTAPRKDPEQTEPIKLITPDYFANSLADKEVRCKIHDVVVHVEPELSNKATVSQISENIKTEKSKSENISENSTKDSPMVTSVEEDITSQSGETSPKSYIESPSEMNHFPHDPIVQKSIKKVASWLHKPEPKKPKGPVVCMGPISFKKKSTISSVSDNSSIRSNSSLALANETNQIGHFVPSKRAEDLSKKYSERGKALERQSEDIWTKAMNEMKAIEKKKKLEQLSSQNDRHEDNGSSGFTS